MYKLLISTMICLTMSLVESLNAYAQSLTEKPHTLYKKQTSTVFDFILYHPEPKTHFLNSITDEKNGKNGRTIQFYYVKNKLVSAQINFIDYFFTYQFRNDSLIEMIPKKREITKREIIRGYVLDNDSNYKRLIKDQAKLLKPTKILKLSYSDFNLYKKRIIDENREIVTHDTTLNRKLQLIDIYVHSVDTMSNLEKGGHHYDYADGTEHDNIEFYDKKTGRPIKLEEENEGEVYYKDNKMVLSISHEFVKNVQYVFKRYFESGKKIYQVKY